MLIAKQLKSLSLRLGADLCGIAPAERFGAAPAGFRPSDIFSSATSVVVIAKRIPEAALASSSPIPYTFATDIVLQEVFRITCELSLKLQEAGITAVPVPSEPYEHWDVEKMEGRGILSLRHAGHLAGLGVLGKNTLLMNDRFGNRITLGALLLDVALEGDPVAKYTLCEERCNTCLDSCPARALDGKSVGQRLCREKSQRTTPKGYSLYICHACRSVCPHGGGLSLNPRRDVLK